MKKLLSIVLMFVMLLSLSIPCYASEKMGFSVEKMSVSDALSDSEIKEYLVSSNEIKELYEVQEKIRDYQYEAAATYARNTLNDIEISSVDVQVISQKLNLEMPLETIDDVVDNGTINIQRDLTGRIIDVWYIYYTIHDSYFSVNAALVDADNPLDSISGTITRYYLNNTVWSVKDTKTFSASNVTNGEVYAWFVYKWGVKEKFEYDITVRDNGTIENFDNVDEENFTRYNFDAKPYNAFTANGGQRHHFIPTGALTNNGFDYQTAYCIRMMTADHRRTGSYGSSTYVSTMSNLLSNGQYLEALQMEVDDLQSKEDCEGIRGNLQQKYYNEVVTCAIQYGELFGVEF